VASQTIKGRFVTRDESAKSVIHAPIDLDHPSSPSLASISSLSSCLYHISFYIYESIVTHRVRVARAT
jgi:hypothetical protein